MLWGAAEGGEVVALDTERVVAFARENEFSLVVLFGSLARGKAEPRDVDLAVWPRSPRSTPELGAALARELRRGDVDVISLPEAGWLLWQEVARDGQPLYEVRPGRFREFQSEALRRSWDAGVWRRRVHEYNQRMLSRRFTLNRDLVVEALRFVHEYLHKLEQLTELDRETFAGDFRNYHAAERLFQLMVEQAAKLNTEVAAALAQTAATDYYSSFFALRTAGWVSLDVAESLGDSARLRNELVHRYEGLRPDQVYDRLQTLLPAWREYTREVQARLARGDLDPGT